MLDFVVVTTKQGKIQGVIQRNIRNNLYCAFRGIPYAQPPIGNLRFKAPQKTVCWDGIRDAKVEGNKCIQKATSSKEIFGSEDCLYLNVYTPNVKLNINYELRPVMFWIHGGLNLEGSGSAATYGPDYLIAEDVILVTINYRLGILGFLALDDSSLKIPGNAAYKDIVMALKWVQENITAFGGNPNNVTVFGESAGACNAHVLMCSPMTKGLFHKVIAQSGTMTNAWAFGTKYAKPFMNMLGFHNLNDKEILGILQQMTAEELVESQRKLTYLSIIMPCRMSYIGPVAEIAIEGEEAFLTDNPIHILKSGNYHRVPLMIGYNNKEGIFFEQCYRNDEVVAETIKNRNWVVPYYFTTDQSMKKQLAHKIINYYKNANKTHREQLYDLVSDIQFVYGIYAGIEIHIATNHQQLYLYKVSVESDLNFTKKMLNIKSEGVAHADELTYLFKTKRSPHIKPGSLEDVSQRRFAKLWTNFARYGNPNPPEKDPLIPVYWMPIRKGSCNVLDIGKNLTLVRDPERAQLDFWRKLATHTSKL